MSCTDVSRLSVLFLLLEKELRGTPEKHVWVGVHVRAVAAAQDLLY